MKGNSRKETAAHLHIKGKQIDRVIRSLQRANEEGIFMGKSLFSIDENTMQSVGGNKLNIVCKFGVPLANMYFVIIAPSIHKLLSPIERERDRRKKKAFC